MNEPLRLNLKCEPDWAVALRQAHPEGVIPGWHMNKRHWNTVYPDKLDDGLVDDLVEHSYELVAPRIKSKP